MSDLHWVLLGIGLGAAAMLPLCRLLLRRAEQRSRDAERRAAEAQRLAELGAMTSGLAHEIKNPLSTIGLNAQLLREGMTESDMGEEDRGRLLRRLDTLRREVERLSGILGDFLHFAGRLKLDARPHHLGRLLDELVDFFHPQCDQAGILLRTQLPPAEVVTRVDERLLKQALLNLLVNAMRAMGDRADQDGPREIILRLEVTGAEARIHVIDTGPGIEPGRLEEIFRPYVSYTSGGTGLGLPTARRIVQEHGGRIEVHSEPGRGSDFVVVLPMAPSPASDGATARGGA